MLSWMTSRAKSAPPENPVDTLVELSVLLAAGLTPDRAWQELARSRGGTSVSADISRIRELGKSLAHALEEVTSGLSQPWRTLGAAWEVARISGAPLGPALRSLAQSIASQDETRRQIDAELAAPQATLRLVSLLPLLALAGGFLGGVDTGSFLFTTTPGLVTLAIGVGCLVLAWWWMRLMVMRVVETRVLPSARPDLFLIALGGGMSPRRALTCTDEMMEKYGLLPPQTDDLPALLELSHRAGVPLARLISARIERTHSVERSESARAVGTLSVHLVLPLGLLVLPGFVLIAVVPLAWGIWNQGVLL